MPRKKKKPARKPEYTTFWRSDSLLTGAKTLAEIAQMMRSGADQLDRMHAEGVTLRDGPDEDDYACFVTTRKDVADKYGMELEEHSESDSD